MRVVTIEDSELLQLAKEASLKGRAIPFEYGEDRLLIKTCHPDFLEREISGYESCSEFYPVPEMKGFFADEANGYLVYKYEDSVGENTGLLVDLFSGNLSPSERDFEKIIAMYESGFQRSLARNRGKAADIFFKERIKTRLDVFYDADFLDRSFSFVLNGRRVSVPLRKRVDEIRHFFRNDQETWCVISQCDPNDLNIGTRPILFDFTAGGYVPLWAEFATLFWYQLAQGSHLSLKYNANAFQGHERIFDTADSVLLEKDSLVHIPARSRLEFVKAYIENVILPLWNRTRDDLWYEQFKHYAAMKILCVFDVTKMEQADQLLSLGYLEAIFNLTPTHPRDLINLFTHER